MSDDEDRELCELRRDLMTIQIERLRQEIRLENRKFLLQAIAAMAASLAAGAATLGLILHWMGKL
jgi:hypothetical protein